MHTALLCVLAWSIALPSSGADYLPSYAPAFEINPEKSILGSRYGGNGLNWGEQDGAFFFRMQNRLQTRFATPFDADPRTLDDLRSDDSELVFRRVRTMLSGNLGSPDLNFDIQYDWLDLFARNAAVIYHWNHGLNLWAGRGKVMYNDERAVSSGRQQFVNRSIVSDVFTLDRQVGLQLHGRLFRDTAMDIDYALGAFGGEGLQVRRNESGRPMMTGMVRWNALGPRMAQQQSDHMFTPLPSARITFGAMSGQGSCTKFESSPEGCTSLRGFIPSDQADGDQFELRQLLLEGKFNWRGLSILSELHWKEVVDRSLSENDPWRKTRLRGGFIQGGVMLRKFVFDLPPGVEVAARYAYVDPDDPRGTDDQREISAVVNWLLDGHNNKLSAELSHLTVGDPAFQETDARLRFRVQWELRF
ncbi:MAG: hypothetical protein ABR612_12580 [Chromatocurvus sp.]